MAVSEISELRNVRIAEIFPTLFHCSTTKIDGPQLNERAVNALRRCQCDKWGDLLALTVGDLWSVHNAGRLTIERILAAAREQADRYSGAPTWAPPTPGTAISNPPAAITAQQRRAQAAVSTFIAHMAEWVMDGQNASTVDDLLV